MSWTWRWLDYSIAIAAVIAGFAIWFVPNFENSPEIKKLYAEQRALKEQRLKYEAQQAEIKKEREDLGLVFIGPAEEPGKQPAKQPAKKPAPKAK
jgi:hypothetical protein